MPKELKPSQIKFHTKWTAIRAKGCTRYIWISGVLSWGLPMLILTTLWDWYDHPSFLNDLTLTNLLGRFLIWTIGGGFFGLSMWHTLESKLGKIDLIIKHNEQSHTA